MKDLSIEELAHYSRQISLKQFGVAAQTKLKHARVLCVGAGGLGSIVLPYLAAAGVGSIAILDGDTVSASNLHRQLLYGVLDIGKSKANLAKQRLEALNPHIAIEAYAYHLNSENAFDLISQYDLVIDGTDNYPTRYLINDVCHILKKTVIFASISQFEGQCTVFSPDSGSCYRCLFPEPPPAGLIPNCAEAGVLGVLPGMLGMIQATEAIKLITGLGEVLKGRLLIYDALSMNFRVLTTETDPNCRLCAQQQPFSDLPRYEQQACELTTSDDAVSVSELNKALQGTADLILLDVREPFERAICNIGGIHIPLNELPGKTKQLDKDSLTVIYCKSDMRSQQALKFLQRSGFTRVKYMRGGMISWIEEIDSSLASYW